MIKKYMKKIVIIGVVLLNLFAVSTFLPLVSAQYSNNPSGNIMKVDGTDISITYGITNGKILDMKVDTQAKSLIVSIQTTGDGVFTITLPRELIDSKINEQDDIYYVLIDGQQTDFQETGKTTTDRTLSIPFTGGTKEIEVIGTIVLTSSSNPTISSTTTSPSSPTTPPQPTSVFTPTQQDIQNINQAKASQTIAAEVNVGDNQSQTTPIDNNVSVQTTSNTPDSLNVNVSASSQTGPKVIAFNLEATTINVANLKDLGVMYDGKLIQPAPNMDAILHAKPTDSPSFAIVVTQSGVQVLVLVPHFSTHSITITNMSKVIPTVPEFGSISMLVFTLVIAGLILIRYKSNHLSNGLK